MIKIGDKVRITKRLIHSSLNKVGDEGIITETDPTTGSFRVSVEGRDDMGNWQLMEELELLEN
jgi:hypothetical protein